MHPLSPQHRANDRDPVCETIEALLRDLESAGRGTLVRSHYRGAVRLRFGERVAEGQTYDIALVRLATAMVDNARYRGSLMQALEGPLHTSP